MDGAGTAMQHMAVPFVANNITDLEGRYKCHLERHLKNQLQDAGSLRLGPHDGDVTKQGGFDRPVEVVVSGPPCPPWAGNGCHAGQDDDRSTVFLSVVRMVLTFIKTGELQCCILENVRGILHKKNGHPSFMDNMISFLEQHAPEFDWNVVTLKAEDYMLPQQRTRVFLRGLRKTVGKGKVPKPLDPFGKRKLVDFLDHSLPSVDKSTLTTTMAKNLADGVKALQSMVTQGDLLSGDIMVWPLDRAEGKIYKRRFSKNIVPTLTTTNKYLFVASLDLEKEEKDRKFFRFLAPSERMLLQGFDESTLAGSSDALRVKGAGNAYPVPLMIAALAPMLSEVRKSLGGKPAQPSLPIKDATDVCQHFDEFMEECRLASTSKGKGAAKKRPAAKAKAAKKKRAASKAKAKAKSEKKKNGKTKKKVGKTQNKKRKDPGTEPKRKARKKSGLGHRSRSRHRWIRSSSS